MSEQFIEKMMALKVELLHFLMNELLEEELEHAHRLFTMGESTEETQLDRGFNDWVIHDYEFEGGYRLIDLYRSNHDVEDTLAQALANSRVSYYSVLATEGRQIMKDLFDHSDYPIGNTVLLDETAVLFTRLYPQGGQYYFLDELTTFDQHYKEYLMRGIMTRFAEAREQLGYLEIGEFLRTNSFLMYVYANIIDDLYIASAESDSLDMFSAVYAVTDHAAFLELVRQHVQIRPLAPEQGVYQLFDEEGLLGEIVDLREKVEFEFISRETLEKSKALIGEIFGDILIHLEDAMITLDDLL